MLILTLSKVSLIFRFGYRLEADDAKGDVSIPRQLAAMDEQRHTRNASVAQ